MSVLIFSKDSYLVFKRLEMPEIESQTIAIEMIEAELTNTPALEHHRLLNLSADVFSNSKDIYGISQRAQKVATFSEKIWVTGMLPHFQVVVVEGGTITPIPNDYFLDIAKLSSSQIVGPEPPSTSWITFELVSTAEYSQTRVLRALEKSHLPLGGHLHLAGLGKLIDNPSKREVAEQIRESLRCGFPSRSSLPKNALEMPSEWHDIYVRIWKTRLTVALYEWALERSRAFSANQANSVLKTEKVKRFVENVINPSISIILDIINAQQNGLFADFPFCEEDYVFFFLLLLSSASESDALKLSMLSQVKSSKTDVYSICNYYQEQHRRGGGVNRVDAVRQYFSTFQNKNTLKNQVDSVDSYKNAIWSVFDNVMSKNWIQLPQRTPDIYEQCIKTDIVQIIRAFLYKTLDSRKTAATIINHFIPDEMAANHNCKIALFPLAFVLGSFPPVYIKKLYDEAVKDVITRWALLSEAERINFYPDGPNRDKAIVLLSELQASVGFDHRSALPPPHWLLTELNNYASIMKVRFFDEWTKHNNSGKIASLTQNAYISFRFNPTSFHVFPVRTLDINDSIANMYIRFNKLQELVSVDSVISVSRQHRYTTKTLELKISNINSFKKRVPKGGQLEIRVTWHSLWQNDIPKEEVRTFNYTVAAEAPDEINASFTLTPPGSGSVSVQAVVSIFGKWGTAPGVEIVNDSTPVNTIIFY